jgi:hypothetical protein
MGKKNCKDILICVGRNNEQKKVEELTVQPPK